MRLEPGCENYPSGLLRLPTPPGIDLRGLWSLPSAAAVAVVGTRRPTRRGMALTAELALALGRAGLGVVSGLAKGIDTAAHTAALQGGFTTAAVLGCGVDVIYPRSNRRLMEAMVEKGALISEHALGTPPLRSHFPKRNRLIAALSRAVVVVEAGLGSGALHTAYYARRLGLPVLVPEVLLDGPEGAGLQVLLRGGALPFASIETAVAMILAASTTVSGAWTQKVLPAAEVLSLDLDAKITAVAANDPDGDSALPLALRQILRRKQGASEAEMHEVWRQEKSRLANVHSSSVATVGAWRELFLDWELAGNLRRQTNGRYGLPGA